MAIEVVEERWNVGKDTSSFDKVGKDEIVCLVFDAPSADVSSARERVGRATCIVL